jgi:biopolymer transport protein ExbD
MNLDSPLTDPWSDDDSMDLTSLKDAFFLLLAFFILAASFAIPALDVRLSEAKNTTQPKPDDQSLTITVDSQGQLFWGQKAVLMPELQKNLQDHPKDGAPALSLRPRQGP